MGQDRAAPEARIRRHLEFDHLAEATTADAPPDVNALRKRFERLKERPARIVEKESRLEPRSH